ncbi:MAG TPA: trehalase family glycosidase [Vicinamibacteria bacterium]|nr:trehalase family glycosidase [Vicinamibacteria bacterium]
MPQRRAPHCAAALLACACIVARPAWAQPSAGPAPSYVTGEAALDALQAYLRPTLEANRKSLVGVTGRVSAFGAGEVYPQVWLRDSATLVPLARYTHDREFLTSWIEEHLAHQSPSGELFDWIAAGPAHAFKDNAPRVREVHRAGSVVVSADRNTSETDQESSAVDAAAQVVALTGDVAWLGRRIRGRTVLQRLDQALRFVQARYLDRQRGLVTSAFTADWGDVSPVYADQRVIYRDERTPVVVGVYTNALFYRATRALAGLYRRAGQPAAAARWEEQAAGVRAAVQRHLWQEERGFFRMHLPVAGPAPPALDDSNFFGMGGNALALLYGLADERQAARVSEVAERRRRTSGIATIAAVLLPPYPRGVFRHPILSEPFTYQNGGQWDWFAGRFLLAQFERGEAARARAQLAAVAARIVRSRGLYEWSTRHGEGRGSAHYAGSAGALGAALFHGLFGIDLRAERLDIRVRLGDHPRGEVHVHQPATGTWVRYLYSHDGRARTMTLDYESNAGGRGTVGLLLPPGATPSAARLGDRARAFRVETVGRDRYVVLDTDWRRQRLVVSLR